MNETMPEKAGQDEGAQQRIVMVVDARPMRQFYTSIFLQRLKYQVIMAKTAEDALLFTGLTVPLVIIANYDLPVMTGLDLLKRVRNDPRTRSVPFIFYTSNRSREVKQACEQAGCSAFLHHLCSLEELYVAVQKATQGRPRRFVRLTTALDVVVGEDRPADGRSGDLMTAISEKGMFVSTVVPLALGAIRPFTFRLPNAPGWLIRVEGQVLFSRLVADRHKVPGMAVKFLQIGDQEREFVREFIKQKLMEGIAPDRAASRPDILRATMGGGPDT